MLKKPSMVKVTLLNIKQTYSFFQEITIPTTHSFYKKHLHAI